MWENVIVILVILYGIVYLGLYQIWYKNRNLKDFKDFWNPFKDLTFFTGGSKNPEEGGNLTRPEPQGVGDDEEGPYSKNLTCEFEGEDIFNNNVFTFQGDPIEDDDNEVTCTQCNQFIFKDDEGCMSLEYNKLQNEKKTDCTGKCPPPEECLNFRNDDDDKPECCGDTACPISGVCTGSLTATPKICPF